MKIACGGNFDGFRTFNEGLKSLKKKDLFDGQLAIIYLYHVYSIQESVFNIATVLVGGGLIYVHHTYAARLNFINERQTL